MNNQQSITVVNFVITDLVNAGALGEKRSEMQWTISRPFGGLPTGAVFQSKDKLISALTTHYVAQLAEQGVLRAAG